MKTALVSLLVALSIVVFFGFATAANKPVLDLKGKELRTGVKYYIVPTLRGAGGGGLTLRNTSRKKCPEAVVQSAFFDDGDPVMFSYPNSKDSIVRVSTNINIKFVPTGDRLCKTSTVWKLSYDGLAGKWLVTVGGVTSNPGPSLFKIEDNGDRSYILSHCPTDKRELCGDLGTYVDEGHVRLALDKDDKGFVWLFQKTN